MRAAASTGRRYEETHPWLTFQAVDMGRAPERLWLLLGEARSKIEHLSGVPLRPETQVEMQRVLLARGAWSTTAIEGNTLSLEEVQARLEGELSLPPSREYLGREIDNVVTAFNLIAEDVRTRGGSAPLTTAAVGGFNRLVLTGLDLEEGVVPGEIRTGSVAVGPYRAVPAEDAHYLLERLCEWLNSSWDPPGDDPDMEVVFRIAKAIVAHVYFEWIHPFGDGNGRTGRLIEFQIMVESGVPFPAAHLLSNHYNATRSEYYRQLTLTSQSGGNLIPFLCYAVEGLVDGLRATISQVQTAQMNVMWENHVHRVLSGTSPAQERRRTLTLELSLRDSPVPRSELETFSPIVAAFYRNTGPRTAARDLNTLRAEGLVEQTGAGWKAATWRMRAFLPTRVT